MEYQSSINHPASLPETHECKNCMNQDKYYKIVMVLLIFILVSVLYFCYCSHKIHNNKKF